MSTDPNLHFALLALKAGLIDSRQLIDAYTSWLASGLPSLPDLLVARGWIDEPARNRINSLVELEIQEAQYSSADTEPGSGGHMPHGAHATMALPFAPPRAPGSPGDSTPLTDFGIAEPSRGSLISPPAADSPSAQGYTLTSVHATGGVGRVWLARDEEIGRDVALKELRPEWAGDAVHSARFLQEARVTGRLEHPGVVPVYTLARRPESGQPFYTMRFVRGKTLSQSIQAYHTRKREQKAEALEFLDLLSAFVAVCNTIAFAHSKGVIHRDLKGQNIVVGDFGEVVVLDWGLAKLIGGDDGSLGVAPETDGDFASDFELDETDLVASESDFETNPALSSLLENSSSDSANLGLTMQGQAMGTPAYMAPEQAAGRLDQIDRRTDVYGLGAILYEILTGRPPFTGTSTVEVLRQVRSHEPEPPSTLAPEVPPALETACLKALAKEPADRFATAGDLGREVQIWEDVERRRAQDDLRQAYDRLMSQQATLVRLTNSKLFQDANLEDIFRELIRAAAETLHVERASLWRFTPDRRAITCTALFERAAGRFSSGMELTAELFPSYFAALDTSDVIAASDAQSDLRTREFTETYLRPLGIGAMMDVPIPPDTMLCNEHVGPPRTWTPDEQMFAIAIAHLAAHAISHWERRVALERLNTRT